MCGAYLDGLRGDDRALHDGRHVFHRVALVPEHKPPRLLRVLDREQQILPGPVHDLRAIQVRYIVPITARETDRERES